MDIRHLYLVTFLLMAPGCYLAHGMEGDGATAPLVVEFDSAEPVAMIAIEHHFILDDGRPAYRVERDCYEESLPGESLTHFSCVIDGADDGELHFNVAVYNPTITSELAQSACAFDPEVEQSFGEVRAYLNGIPLELDRVPFNGGCNFVAARIR